VDRFEHRLIFGALPLLLHSTIHSIQPPPPLTSGPHG
jgi:hypothetical protein